MSLVLRGSARQIVLVNRNRNRANGVVTDVQYGAVLSHPVSLLAGGYADVAGSGVVMITAGINEKGGGAIDRSDPAGRLRLLKANAEIYEDIVPLVRQAAPDALILVVTDPPDPLADLVRQLGHQNVLSSGTYLDSLRFRFHLARRLRVSPASVSAVVVGEHGTSQVFLWSSVRVGGGTIQQGVPGGDRQRFREEIEQEVRYANITIIEWIGASQYGIGMVCARIAEIILNDERTVIPIGSYQEIYGVTLSLPSIVGRNGVEKVLEPEMSDEEQEKLSASAVKLRASLREMGD